MKISSLIFIIGLLFFIPKQVTLDDLKWKKRVILVFPASDSFEMELNDSLRLEIEIRDVIYFVFADSLQTNGDYQMEREYIEGVRAKYLLGAKSACWVLLGKDGGIKQRKEEELDWNEALQTVDERGLQWELVSW